jgi:hypothetical protein
MNQILSGNNEATGISIGKRRRITRTERQIDKIVRDINRIKYRIERKKKQIDDIDKIVCSPINYDTQEELKVKQSLIQKSISLLEKEIDEIDDHACQLHFDHNSDYVDDDLDYEYLYGI